MADLNDLRNAVKEYIDLYRKPGLAPIEESPVYALDKTIETPGVTPELFWPDTWPNADRRGIYAIFSYEVLLYVGKASQQPIGNRLGSYFQFGKDKVSCATKPNQVWTASPTHVITWAVPDESFFEASALEEYLISRLASELPDNVRGKS